MPTTTDAWLVDTNVVLRWALIQHPQYPIAARAVEALVLRGVEIYVTPQSLVEAWNVCTRPLESNGFGLTPQTTRLELGRVKSFFRLAADSPDVFPVWERLVADHDVSGVKVHDARLAAFMEVYEIPNILTFNTRDFARYAGIAAVNPRDIASVI